MGFSAERVHPFMLETYVSFIPKQIKDRSNGRPDKERIFAWHVLPLDKQATESKEGEHLDILRNDKTARVIVYCMWSVMGTG